MVAHSRKSRQTVIQPMRWSSEPVWRDTPAGPRQYICQPSSIPGGPPEEIPVAWAPQRWSQQLFLKCPLMECLLEGGRGTGKTDCLLVDFLQHVGMGYGPAWRGILFRRAYKQLDDVIRKSKHIFKEAYPTARFTGGGGGGKWSFPTGEELVFRTMKNDKQYEEYHGHEYTWIGWEELCSWASLGAYKRMFSTLRSAHQGVVVDGIHYPIPLKVRGTANPYGVGHNLVRNRWELPQGRNQCLTETLELRDGSHMEVHRTALHSKYEENVALHQVQPGYMAQILMAARNQSEREAWEWGSWDIIAGGMFDSHWRGAEHILQRFEIPASWRLDRSFDWGWSAPFSVLWFAESDGSPYVNAAGQTVQTVRGDVFIVNEWYGCRPNSQNEGLELIDSDIAKGTMKREKAFFGNRIVQAGPADESIFDSPNGHTIATTMQKNGCRWTRSEKSGGSRVAGWSLIRNMMDGAIRKGNRPRQDPGLFVFDHCKEWIRTVPTLPRDDENMDDVDTGSEDHAGDATRYRLHKKRDQMATSPLAGR